MKRVILGNEGVADQRKNEEPVGIDEDWYPIDLPDLDSFSVHDLPSPKPQYILTR